MTAGGAGSTGDAPGGTGGAPGGIPGPFVSYAQNFEDVMLWRALGHIDEGFYIDVGAASPDVDSVTRAFSERGWHGVNVEPHPDTFRALEAARPRDVNLMVALGDTSGQSTIWLGRHPTDSTLAAGEAERLRDADESPVPQPVTVMTLDSVWAAHVPPGQDVHFVKVDVEGFEREVLLGADWHVHRPWIVVVEATRPHTPELSHEAWEAILTSSDYDAVYFDGLNRFYLAREHAALRQAFDRPPNVFDGFVRAGERDARLLAKQLQRELAGMRASRSWRWTAPLRMLGRLARRRRR